jgi:hypothetical protein
MNRSRIPAIEAASSQAVHLGFSSIFLHFTSVYTHISWTTASSSYFILFAYFFYTQSGVCLTTFMHLCHIGIACYTRVSYCVMDSCFDLGLGVQTVWGVESRYFLSEFDRTVKANEMNSIIPWVDMALLVSNRSRSTVKWARNRCVYSGFSWLNPNQGVYLYISRVQSPAMSQSAEINWKFSSEGKNHTSAP